MTDSRSDSVTFASLGLKPEVMEGIREAGFVTCTPIQAQTLPIALAGRDVAGQAQTGTGKTAAFLVALYQALLTRPAAPGRSATSIRALVVAPTRELAVQIHRDALVLGAHTGFRHLVVFGGIDYEKQRQQLLDGCDVLIGTPGRLIDYFKQHVSRPRYWCSMRPTACLIWASSLISVTSCGVCPRRGAASQCCSPPPCRTGCSSWRTST